MNMKLNQSGMSILGVAVAVAVLATLTVQLTNIYDFLNTSSRKTTQHMEADSFVRGIQEALTQPGVCDNALRLGLVVSPLKATWPLATPWANIQLGHIELPSGGGQAVAVSAGQAFPKFTVRQIYLRKPLPLLNEGTSPDGRLTFGPGPGPGVAYTTRAAKLTFVIDYGSSGQQQRVDKTIDLIVAIKQAAPAVGQIDHCYQPQQIQAIDRTCGQNPGQSIYPGLDCPGAAPPGCSKFYSVMGFDGFGQPKCVCNISCQTYRVGPKGTAAYSTGRHGNWVMGAGTPQPCPTCINGVDQRGLTPMVPTPGYAVGPTLLPQGATPGAPPMYPAWP